MSGYRVIKKLTAQGNVVIGAGCYSAAIKTRNDTVLKVGTTLEDPWLDFYEDVAKDSNNPHLIKVYKLTLDKGYYYYVAYTELLQARPESETAKLNHFKLSSCINDYIYESDSTDNIISKLKKYHSVTVPNPEVFLHLIDKLKSRVPDGCRMDLHCNNFMYRGNIAVIIDPWCEQDIPDEQNVEEWLEESSYGESSDSYN